MVLIDALAPLDPLLLAVNPRPLIVDLAAAAGRELVIVRRTLDPGLLALNDHGARNGHVPITAIVSLIAVVAAALYGADTIAMAIERSASEETSIVDGVAVNHQFSKSLEFERALAGLLTTSVDPGLRYGSAVRPYSELAIARAFSRMDRYHRHFVSCNAAFRMDAPEGTRWCGQCPKCRFVALMLAPFLDRDQVESILGADLFHDLDQIPGFASLFSDDDKPYECVGERRESAVAMLTLADRPEWRSSPVVRALAPVAASVVSATDRAEVWAPDRSLDHPDPVVAKWVRHALERPVEDEPHR